MILNPLQIIKTHTQYKDARFINRFMMLIEHLYQYEIFKDVLDMVATRANEDLLHFNVQDRSIFDFDEGNCKTIFSDGILDTIKNTFSSHKKYFITIKKINSEVIMHEIGHMIEHEIAEGFEADTFTKMIGRDISESDGCSTGLKNAVNNVMIREIRGYPKEQHASELLARYFQIIAGAKEIAGHAENYGYSVSAVISLFKETGLNIKQQFELLLRKKINNNIAKVSEKYIKSIKNIKNYWADYKIESLSGNVQNRDIGKINSNANKQNIGGTKNAVNNISSGSYNGSYNESYNGPYNNEILLYKNNKDEKKGKWSKVIKSVDDTDIK